LATESHGKTQKDRGRESEVSGQESGEGIREGKEMFAKSAKDLRVYQKAYALAMEIFQISKRWPVEEKYFLN